MPANTYDPEAFRRFEHDGWSEVAARYQDSFGQLTIQSVPRLLEATGIRAGQAVLDLACGTGVNAAGAVRLGAAVTGLDLSQAMVGEATRLCPGAAFRQGDAEDLPFEPRVFDAVLCGFGLLHFPRPEVAVREVFRVLKPGGRFGCTVWLPEHESPYLALVNDAIDAHGSRDVGLPPGPAPYQFGDFARLKSLLEAPGFVDVQRVDAPITIRLRDESEVLDALLEGGVRARKLIEAQTDEARARIEAHARQAAAQFRVGDAVEIPRPAMVATATKPG